MTPAPATTSCLLPSIDFYLSNKGILFAIRIKKNTIIHTNQRRALRALKVAKQFYLICDDKMVAIKPIAIHEILVRLLCVKNHKKRVIITCSCNSKKAIEYLPITLGDRSFIWLFKNTRLRSGGNSCYKA